MIDPQGCCAPSRSAREPAGPVSASTFDGSGRHDLEQCQIPGGTYLMGDQSGDGNRPDGETPVHAVELTAFSIDATPVTNEAFGAFVDATGFVTEAERFGYSAVFHLAVAADSVDVLSAVAGSPWWRGRSWRRLATSGRTLVGSGRTRRAPGRPRELERCRDLLRMGRSTTSDRSRVGVRSPWGAGRRPVPMG